MRRLGSPHSNGTPKRGPECDITLAPSPDEPVIMGKQPLRLCASTPPQPSPAPTPSLELLGGGKVCCRQGTLESCLFRPRCSSCALGS